VGEITYAISGTDCEIVSFDSLLEGMGVGTRLIHAVVDEARKQNCRRVFLITTNDNLHALGFINDAALNWQGFIATPWMKPAGSNPAFP
jgi:predicted N-acetyltransferase YhbS